MPIRFAIACARRPARWWIASKSYTHVGNCRYRVGRRITTMSSSRHGEIAMNIPIGIALRGVLVVLACFSSAVHAIPQLLVPVPPSAARPPATQPARGIPVRFNAEEMFALPLHAEAALALPDGTLHRYVFELAQDHGSGIRSWIGKHRDLGTRHRVVVTTGPAGSFGALSTPTAEYRLRPGPSSDLLIDARTDPEPGPAAGDALVPPAIAKSAPRSLHAASPFIPKVGIDSVALPKATPTPSFDVDLMIVYNRGLATQLGDSLMTNLHFQVMRTNTALADSEIAVRVRLVRAVQVEYEEPVNDLTAIYAVTPACRPTNACPVPFDEKAFGNVEAMREAAGADLVMLLRNFGGGRAWVGGEPPSPLFMYSVVGCASCDLIFAHELGHNMGIWHDRATTAFQAGGTSFYPQGVRPYAYGYAYCSSGALSCNPELPPGSGGCTGEPQCSTQSPENFSDLMAYFTGSTVKNFKFSNPRVTCSGSSGFSQPCGIPDGMAGSADAAQAINEFRASLSAIKPTVEPPAPPPTFVRFTAPQHFAPESSLAASVLVQRQGTAPGTLQVRYRTRDGSALTSLDYTAANGTISWDENDFAAKTIQVPIADDGVAEGGEFFTLELFEPTGSVEAYVDGASTTTVVITEDWPAGGAMPSGFSTPAGSNGAWTLATDHAFEGSTSLRSAQVYGSFATSRLSFTGQFNAGVVAFAYRLSMFPHPRTIFEFAIDGRVVLQGGGESGWKLFSAPISAGMHELTWTVVNFESSTCSGHPDAPGGAGCADRAWIDAVMLPLAKPDASVSLRSSPNPSTVGAPVTLSADVSGGSAPPAGFVSFRDAGEAIPGCSRVALASGSAACVTSSLAQGARTITAVYSGDSVYDGGAAASLVQTVDAGTAPRRKALPDFNGDGKADLLFEHENGSTRMTSMNGAVPLASTVLLGPGTGWFVAHTGDFNGDGRTDLLWQHPNGTLSIWLMDGSTATTAKVILQGGTGWLVSHIGDFNGDGKADLLFRHPNGSISTWLMNGAAPIASRVLLQGGTGWEVAHVGDFNGDGNADLLFRNAGGSHSIWTMNGTAMTGARVIIGAGSGYSVTHTLDLDGDGKTDLLWRHTNGTTSAWLMNGLHYAAAKVLLNGGTGWLVTHAGDFNADGRDDLAWRHPNGSTSIWMMNGTAMTAAKVILQGGTGWTVALTRDTSGDANSDLVWTNPNGSASVWLMNGMASTAARVVEPPNTGWTLADNGP
jgi:hypothetical protein